WDTVTGNELFEPSRGHRHWAWSIAFAPNGRHIVSSSIDETVRIWDAETGAAVADPLKGHSAGVSSIAFSPNGSRIATGSGDSTVRVWDMENLRTHDQFVVGGFFAALFIFAHSGEQIEDLFTAPLKRLVSTSVLAHYINKSGWVTSSSGALLLWLPKQRQRVDDSLIQISIAPTSGHMLLDFSRFAHGGSWASV
ncbi:WD40 repeat-like protein, partial [Ceratobasidium sp. AG-I]